MQNFYEIGQHDMGFDKASFPVVIAAVRIEPGIGIVHSTAVKHGKRSIALVRGLHLGQ